MRVTSASVLLLLLAGCTAQAPGDDAGVPGVPESPATSPVMTQSGCQASYSSHTVDLAWAEARMPDGFEPFPRDDGAWFTAKSWSCGASTVDGDASAVGVVSLLYLAVQPPEHFQHEDAGFYWLPLEIMADDAGFQVFDAWGFPATNLTSSTFDRTTAAVAQRLHSEASSDRGTDLAVDVVIDEQTEGESFLVRYFAARDGTVTGALDITVHPGSRGTGTTVLGLSGPDAPFSGPEQGDGTYQGWPEDAPSYTLAFTPL